MGSFPIANGFKTGGKNFKKGQTGNPDGRPPLIPEAKDAPPIDKASLNRLLNEAFNETDDQRDAVLNDPNASQIRKWIRAVVKAGGKEADIQRLNGLLDRAIGKVKEQIEVSGNLELSSALHKARERIKSKQD